MFEKSNFINKKKLTYFFLIVYSFYVIAPYLLFLFDNFFLKNVLTFFPEESHDQERKYVITILKNTNFHYVFFINSFLFFITSIFFIKLISIKENYKNIDTNFKQQNLLFFLFNFIVTVCLILLIYDIYDFFVYLKSFEFTLGDYRNNAYTFIEGRIQTHYVIGSIFSIYLLIKKKYFISIPFILGIILIELITFSRFYIFLVFVSILVLSNKRVSLFLCVLIFILVFYRIFISSPDIPLNKTLLFFAHNLFWEPISLWCTEIIKLQNFLIEINKIYFLKEYFLKNFFSNFLFFDFNKTYYVFKENIFPQFGSYANYGYIDMIAYPLQTLFLIVMIYFLKKIIDRYFILNNLFIVLFIFSLFKILRGSSMDGFSFILKFELLLIFIIIFCSILSKLNLFKSGS